MVVSLRYYKIQGLYSASEITHFITVLTLLSLIPEREGNRNYIIPSAQLSMTDEEQH